MNIRRVVTHRDVHLYLLAAALLAAGVFWLLQNHYLSEIATQRWAAVMGVFDAESVRLENLGLVYPHLPVYVLVPFHFLGFTDSPAVPYYVPVLFGAALLVLWNRHLRTAGFGGWLRLAMVLLLLVHPALLWSFGNGSHTAISLLMFYLLYVACLRMLREQDIHAFILLGVVLAVFFFVDEVTFFLFVALAPLIVILAPRRIFAEAPLSVYVIVFTPLAVVIGAWLYLNWLLQGSPWAFLHDPRSTFVGGRRMVEAYWWLREYGGEWLRPSAIALLLTVAAFPVIALLLTPGVINDTRRRSALVLLLHPIIAIGFATSEYFLRHPIDIMVLIAAGVMAELTTLDPKRHLVVAGTLVLLAAGAASGWALFLHSPTPQMERWSQALVPAAAAPALSGDVVLGRWLAEHREPTLMDDRSGFRVITERGDATGLVLPTSDQFKLDLRRARPETRQLAVPDPATAGGIDDALNRRHPTLYREGLEGYELVYDRDGWRVWRRAD